MITTCADQHRCKNGSFCVEKPKEEGSYFCDCDVEATSVLAGLSCEHVGTAYCTVSGEVSKSSFCTNEGDCVALVESTDAPHMGCECVPGYTGDFCQFIEDQNIPENWPTLTASEVEGLLNKNSGSGGDDSDGPGGIVIATAAIGGVAVLSMAFFVIKRRRKHAQPHTVQKTRTDGSQMQLDSDGDVLSKAMSPSSSESSISMSTSPRSFIEEVEVGADII